MLNVLLVIIAYFIGSIPTSVWLGRRFYSKDVREHGSGNSGATNTLRVLGKRAGLVVLVIDILKGWAAVGLICFSPLHHQLLTNSHQLIADKYKLEIILGMAALIGHIFPIYTGFRGGKGVATSMGIIIAFSPIAALLCMVVFACVLIISHYVSMASMISMVSFPVWMATLLHNSYPNITAVHDWLLVFSVFLPLLVIFMHRKNIQRVLTKQESKIKIFKR